MEPLHYAATPARKSRPAWPVAAVAAVAVALLALAARPGGPLGRRTRHTPAVEARDLIGEYRSDGAAAARRYGGREVEVEGVAEGCGTDPDGRPCVWLATGSPWRGEVRLSFDHDRWPWGDGGPSDGARVGVVGRVAGWKAGTLAIESCRRAG